MRAVKWLLWAALVWTSGLETAGSAEPPIVRVGSKVFTESVVLAEVAVQLAQSAGARAEHVKQLGGTRVVWDALINGEIDVYPEYTGTIREEILVEKKPGSTADLRRTLAAFGVGMTAPLGFNNTYALGMRRQAAEQLQIANISDLRRHANLTFALSNEFIDRQDGWPALRKRYRLPQKNVRGMDHDLAYRALASGAIDLTDLYSTDAEIVALDLRVLKDDLAHFPRYDAVFLYRADLARRAPKVLDALALVTGQISQQTMISMNAQAKLKLVPESRIAREFLAQRLGIATQAAESTWLDDLLLRTREHLLLVCTSLAAAIALGVPLGVLAAYRPGWGHLVLGTTAAIYTIPSLALLVFMIPLFGIGTLPAILALFLYSLLPIVRNTHAGLQGIPAALRESAEVLGLSGLWRLVRIELPLAMPSILAGIKTSAVINVGTATLGALIAAGGYGQPILTGIRLGSTRLILEGAIPAALMALAAQGLFELLERVVTPRGLRIAPKSH